MAIHQLGKLLKTIFTTPMSSKILKNLKSFLITFLAVFLSVFAAISFAQISESKFANKESKSKASKVDYDENFLSEIVARVKKDYVEEKSDSQLFEAAANGILTSLDPHSSFLNQENLKEMQVQTKGEFGGIGVEISSELSVIKVVSAIEDTPAFKAGIKTGDYIISINDKSIVGQGIEEVVKKIRGKAGSSVKLTIVRKDEKKPIEKSITRQIIKVKAVKAKRFKDVAYIKITTFSEKATSGVVLELKKLKNQIGEKDFRGLVLDLRNNPGGLLDQAIEISDLFLKKNQNIVSIKGKSGKEAIFNDKSDDNLIGNLPIVVLVNEGSASASEIVAGALQDNKRAIVMGKKTFGKGSVQTIIPIEGNKGAIKMTTALYYTPSGKSIQAHGIEPDIELAEAKIEKQKQFVERSSEADLKGHIEIQIKEAIESSQKERVLDDNSDIYESDYQLARAIDLIRGVRIFDLIKKK